jgi:hypothetical protein
MLACKLDTSIDAANLFLDEAVPRSVWDADLLPRLTLILAFFRQIESADPLWKIAGAYLHGQAQKPR